MYDNMPYGLVDPPMNALKEPERINLAGGLALLKSQLPVDEAKGHLRRAFIQKAFSQEPCFAFAYEEADIDWTTGYVKIPRKMDRFCPTFRRSDFNRYFFGDRMPSDSSPAYSMAAAKAVCAAIEALASVGQRAYSLSVPLEAENILVRREAGRISRAEAGDQISAAIIGLAKEGKLEVFVEGHKDWLIKEPLAEERLPMPTKFGRDKNLIRTLMLKLEGMLRPGVTNVLSGYDAEVAVQGYTPEQINHHLSLLAQMGYVDLAGSQPTIGAALKGLTPKGYDFLDRNRDEVVETSHPSAKAQLSRKIFIVHGRDDGAKNEVALFLRKIGLEDIILHQRPNRGRHLLTKFQEEAQGASFAVVLMTPDDEGGIVGEEHQKRARQNVVFELGFFIGKFETPRVAALIRPGVEKPSDFDGICWIEFDSAGGWKNLLARELREAGVPFDAHEVFTA
jgi:hypothetical protein